MIMVIIIIIIIIRRRRRRRRRLAKMSTVLSFYENLGENRAIICDI